MTLSKVLLDGKNYHGPHFENCPKLPFFKYYILCKYQLAPCRFAVFQQSIEESSSKEDRRLAVSTHLKVRVSFLVLLLFLRHVHTNLPTYTKLIIIFSTLKKSIYCNVAGVYVVIND